KIGGKVACHDCGLCGSCLAPRHGGHGLGRFHLGLCYRPEVQVERTVGEVHERHRQCRNTPMQVICSAWPGCVHGHERDCSHPSTQNEVRQRQTRHLSPNPLHLEVFCQRDHGRDRHCLSEEEDGAGHSKYHCFFIQICARQKSNPDKAECHRVHHVAHIERYLNCCGPLPSSRKALHQRGQGRHGYRFAKAEDGNCQQNKRQIYRHVAIQAG